MNDSQVPVGYGKTKFKLKKSFAFKPKRAFNALSEDIDKEDKVAVKQYRNLMKRIRAERRA